METTKPKLSLAEKAALLEGYQTWKTNPISSNGIRALYMTDGPHGLRRARGDGSGFAVSDNAHSTAFPTAVSVASSWNPENAYRMGRAIAGECVEAGVDVLLAPGVNIKRSPLCGRNFEYFSEDPLVSGVFGEAFAKGVQSLGVGCAVKHFAANSNEDYRFVGDSVLDERALREIYLRAFERVIKSAKPFSVMCAYNKINGVYASQNTQLLTGILRDEWGFNGIVMTDWGATVDRVLGVKAGCDLDMPGGVWHNRKTLIEAGQTDRTAEKAINQSVDRMLGFIENCAHKQPTKCDIRMNEAVSKEIALDSAVLMKNDGVLPLKGSEKLLVVGEMFEKIRYQGAGSSLINPPTVTSAKNAFDSRGIKYTYHKGYRSAYQKNDAKLAKATKEAASGADVILFFGGLTDFEESEGFDRQHMDLDIRQQKLIDRLVETGKPVVLVLHVGAPVIIPRLNDLAAVLNMYLSGMHGGEATAALLFGERSPSGKLAESWPMRSEDISCADDYNKGAKARYYESIYVGYRFYDKAKTDLQFPFGFGLSYTTFEYRDLQVTADKGKITVAAEIKNIGNSDGAEAVQLYVKNPSDGVFKADKELRAFQKVFLKKGEAKRIDLSFDISDLSYWHVKKQQWVLENGEYTLCLSASANDIRLTQTLAVKTGEEAQRPYSDALNAAYQIPPQKDSDLFDAILMINRIKQETTAGQRKKCITLSSQLRDFKKTWMGRILYSSIMFVIKKDYTKARRMKDSIERDARMKNAYFVMQMMPKTSILAMCMSSSGQFAYHTASGMVEMANGRILSGLKMMMKKEKMLPLPNETKGENG